MFYGYEYHLLSFWQHYLETFEISFCSLHCLCILQVPLLLVVVLVSDFNGQHLSKMCLFLGCPLIFADKAISAGWKLWVYGWSWWASWPYDQILGPRSLNVSADVFSWVDQFPRETSPLWYTGSHIYPPFLRMAHPPPLSCACIWESGVSLVQPQQKADIWPSARMGEYSR